MPHSKRKSRNYFEDIKKLSDPEKDWFIKTKELELKEIELTQARISREWWYNPLLLAAIGLFANVIVTWYNASNQREIENDKARATAILDAIRTGDTAQAKVNLDFLIRVGLLKDNDGKIKLYLSNDSNIPVLPIIDRKTYYYPTNVFICTQPNAYSYHLNLSCPALNRCTDSIAQIAIDSAGIFYNRRACKICF